MDSGQLLMVEVAAWWRARWRRWGQEGEGVLRGILSFFGLRNFAHFLNSYVSHPLLCNVIDFHSFVYKFLDSTEVQIHISKCLLDISILSFHMSKMDSPLFLPILYSFGIFSLAHSTKVETWEFPTPFLHFQLSVAHLFNERWAPTGSQELWWHRVYVRQPNGK